jgi:tRNA pseudouridine65 synthase
VPNNALPILYVDRDLVVVDKPAGLAVHRGWAPERDVAMVRVRNALGCHVFPVHRLDRATSGVLVFALHQEAARALGESFAGGAVEKTYLALVRGVLPEEGRIDYPLPPGEDRNEARVPALSLFVRRAVFGRYALVEIRPLTGRLHQIRRHMKHISCPLIGDVNYGKGEHNRWFREHFGLHRLFLHATQIRLPHPGHAETLLVESVLPSELLETLARLRCGDGAGGPQAKTEETGFKRSAME